MHQKKFEDKEWIVRKDYSKKIIFSYDEFKEKGHLLQVVTIPPHTKQRLHTHNQQTEVYYVLEGETYITIGNHEFLAKPGDGFMTHPGDIHSLWNKSNATFKLLVFKINYPQNNADTVWIE